MPCARIDDSVPCRGATISTRASPGGGGRKARAGTCGPSAQVNERCDAVPPAPRPPAHRAAAHDGTTSAARCSRLPREVSLRSNAVVTPNGGFATTLNGRRGSHRSAASARTTFTARPANRSRRNADRSSCSSMATTRAPAHSSASVMTPRPAPTSKTRSPGETSASATSRPAQRGSSWCQPQRAACPGCPDTEDHHHRHGVESDGHGQRVANDFRTPDVFTGVRHLFTRSSTARRLVVDRAGLTP
jgi:hypothetical protein